MNLVGIPLSKHGRTAGEKMPGLLEFEMELSRRAIIAIAERELSRALTERERAGIQRISSLLQLDSICRAFNSPAYMTAKLIADLELLAKQPMQK